MTKNMLVRCPTCHREHSYVPAKYPCACGATVTPGPPPAEGVVPVPVPHQSWSEAWTEADCPCCGRPGQWPRPEFTCPCGTTVRFVPARPAPGQDAAGAGAGRPPFRPLTIRTAHDATACAGRFLRWLGFADVYAAKPRPGAGGGAEDGGTAQASRAWGSIALRGPAIVGLVDASTHPTDEGTVETLWLHGLNESAQAVAFSLAGYDRRARARADGLCLPLFVFDLAGTPQPVNEPAAALLRGGGPDAPPP